MDYRPWCPKCGQILYLDDSQWPPTVRCRCGYNLVDTNHVQALVNQQKRILAERAEKARQRAAAAPPPPPAPQPTEAQKRRYATHPVECAVCGTITFRRKKEAEKGGPFFCNRAHQDQWQKDHPVGMFRIVKEAG